MGARLGLPTCLAGRNEPPLDELHGLAIWTAVGGILEAKSRQALLGSHQVSWPLPSEGFKA